MIFTTTKKDNNPLFFIFSLCFILSGGYFYATPYISILRFKLALEGNNTNEAANYVNFSALRISLKEQLTEKISKKISSNLTNEMKYNPLRSITMALVNPFASSIINTTIDSTISPSGLKLLLEKGS